MSLRDSLLAPTSVRAPGLLRGCRTRPRTRSEDNTVSKGGSHIHTFFSPNDLLGPSTILCAYYHLQVGVIPGVKTGEHT